MDNNQPKNFNFLLKGSNSKAILLIHGITGTPSEMRYLGKSLNKAGYTIYCNTLPRHCSTLGELKKVTWQEIFESVIQDLRFLEKDYPFVFVGGLSMGALMAVHLAFKFPERVRGLIALAPTFFYDGWALHKGKVLLNLAWHVPYLRNAIDIREGWPYGLKDEELRGSVERFYKGALANKFYNKVLLFGSPFFPLVCLYQHHLFSKIVKNELSSVKLPIIIIHAKEDDMTSLRNANFLYEKIGSSCKSLVVLEDSYHMITIDKDKDRVAGEIINFLGKI
jgi:carboxylesterase